jgi:hypothetical protein
MSKSDNATWNTCQVLISTTKCFHIIGIHIFQMMVNTYNLHCRYYEKKNGWCIISNLLLLSTYCLCILLQQWDPSHLCHWFIYQQRKKQMKEGKHWGSFTKHDTTKTNEQILSTINPSDFEILDFVWNHVIDNFIGESTYFFGENCNYNMKDFFWCKI